MADTSNTGPAAVAAQLKTLWGNQSRGKKLLAVLVVAAVVGVVALSRLAGRGEEWVVMSAGVSPDDSHELLATLQARQLPVRLREGTIEVPASKVDQARAIAAAAGLPRAGKGFELFDGSTLGQSSFTEQVNFKRALQGEIARSITALAQVDGARVHLALGKRSVFKDREEVASASVALHLHPGQTLAPEQVRGIRQLVAASVEGMRSEAVVVVDNHGNLLDGADPSSADRQANLERTLTARVRSMLERVVGAGKVSVVTTAMLDDREVSETQEVFDNTNPVIRSESRTVEGLDASSAVGGMAGARANLPGMPAGAPAPGGAANGRLQETKNFEISRTVRSVKKPDALLQRLYLAVVVDFKQDKDGKPQPRTAEELAELTALARQAAGIDDARGDKVEVRSIPFAPDVDPAFGPVTTGPTVAPGLPLIPIAIGGGALLLVLIVMFAAMARRGRRRANAMMMPLALPAPIGDLERVLEARNHANALPEIPEPHALGPGKPSRDRVIAAVRADVERTAEVLTAWLSEPKPRGSKS